MFLNNTVGAHTNKSEIYTKYIDYTGHPSPQMRFQMMAKAS